MTARLIVALVVAAVVLPSGAGAADVDVSVRIAKTNDHIEPFGSVEPAHPRGDVSVRLFRFVDGGWKPIGKKTAELGRARDTDGDGVEESSYRTQFRRPATGECRVVVRFASDARGKTLFPCYIPDFSKGSATLDGRVDIDLLIADDNSERSYGLMYRPHMRDELGMAFLWEEDTSGGFWMKNTLIPLSIAFFDGEGTILKILHMKPCEEDPCPSYDPGVTYRGALEVNRGMFDEWDVALGDRIEITP